MRSYAAIGILVLDARNLGSRRDVMRLFCFLSLLSCSALASTDQPEVLFAKAHALSAKGNYKKAIKAYSQIFPKGHDVYFNMGSAAFGAKEYGRALLCWRRAEKCFNWSDRLRLLSNIDRVQKIISKGQSQSFIGQYITGPWNQLKQFKYSILVSLPLLPIQLLFLFCWFSPSGITRVIL